jgi:mannose-6-phosphate isomerase-like protein (cupin superfamily)
MTRPASSLAILHRAKDGALPAAKLGPYEIEALIAESEEGAGTAYRVRIGPHQKTSTSYHQKAEEFYYVVAGAGAAYLNGVAHALAPGDFLRLPPGVQHRFETQDLPLEMLDIHIPGCRPDRDTFFVDEVPDGFGPG